MIIRFSYSVLGPVKFLSHLDLLKLFSKAVKRAEIPIAYSEGFNPHPKISFGPPRGVAVAAAADYCDMRLATVLSAQDFSRRLNLALPKGIRIQQARVIDAKLPALMAAINLADYEVLVESEDMAALAKKVEALLAAEEVIFIRHNPKKADREINVRSGLVSLALTTTKADCGILNFRLRFAKTGSVKASEVTAVLLNEPAKALMTRTALYIEDEQGKISEP